MAVNTSIHSEVEIIVLTNTAIKDLVEELMKEYCSAHERSENLTDELSCEMEEYEHTKEVIGRIDDIQDILFNKNSEEARLDAMLGYIDIMKTLEQRIGTIFREETIVRCPDEVTIIKADYM